MTLSTKIGTTIRASEEAVFKPRLEAYLASVYEPTSAEYTSGLADSVAYSEPGWDDMATVVTSIAPILGAPEFVLTTTALVPTFTGDQCIFEVDTSAGSLVIPLPEDSIVGKMYIFVKITADINTVTLTSVDTIEGGNVILATQYDKTQVIKGTSVWLKLI